MDTMQSNAVKSRREMMKLMAMGSTAGLFGIFGPKHLKAVEKEKT